MASTNDIALAERDTDLLGTDTIPVENPATGRIIGHVPAMTAVGGLFIKLF